MHTIEGDREDSQTVLVAICTFGSILYYSFLRFLYTSSSLEPLLFLGVVEHFISDHSIEERKNILSSENWFSSLYSGATRNHLKMTLDFSKSIQVGCYFIIVQVTDPWQINIYSSLGLSLGVEKYSKPVMQRILIILLKSL